MEGRPIPSPAVPAPRTSITAKHRRIGKCPGANGACYICYESQPPPIQSGCACRDEAGFVHIECMVQVAVSQVAYRGNIAWWECHMCYVQAEVHGGDADGSGGGMVRAGAGCGGGERRAAVRGA
jgi:hypothetical protein